jgi:cytochrome P450/nitrite reductase/ring-hydroxylating ferredoxin subunit
MSGRASDVTATRSPSAASRVAQSEELRGAGPFASSADGVDVAIVRTPAGLRAFQGRCPHQGALLGEGELDAETLVCRNHRWQFRLADGRRVGGPECLASYPLLEQNGEVFVDTRAARIADASRSPTRRHIRDLPGPRGLPLVGNLLQLDLSRLHQVLEGWAEVHGPVYRYRMGPKWIVAVSEPALSEQVLRARPETYRRLSDVEPVFAETGVAGVFSAEGAAWRPQRRLAMEALSHRHLRGFYPSLDTVAQRLLKRWDRVAAEGGRTDILDDLKRFTVDVTTLLTFGHDANTLERGKDVIQRHLELVFPAFNRRLFALVPTWRFLRTPADRRLDRALGELRKWLRGLVQEARARGGADALDGGRPSNFLEAMLSARDDAGRPFSDDVIFGNLMTMLLAGEDTTAYTLAWVVHHLCDSPRGVAALRAEIDSVLGSSAVPEDIETANRLTYAGAVAHETMRLRPVAPIQFNETNVDTALGDLFLPAGTPVVVLARAQAHDPKSFAEPRAFRPERWLAPEGAHDVLAHIPFGSGPRLCPGRTLALLEIKVVLAALYKRFTVEREGPSGAVRERFAFTMFPEGLVVRLARRG